MLVFIGNLPGDASLLELQHFLGNHEMSVDYSTHRDKSADKEGSHFLLIKTNCDESADDLIKELNGKQFHQLEIQARRFIKRREQQAWSAAERRTNQLNFDF